MDQVQEIREKTDIVSLISEYVSLKPAGQNLKGLCPFHNEKTPSFIVSPERGIWHCFGCGKGGDAYSFLMEYEHMEFPEALRILAKRAGIKLESITPREQGIISQKELIYEINHVAMEFYHYILTKHKAGKAALSYVLDHRKISSKVIEAFMLGYAPSSGVALSAYLTKKKYKKEDLLASGIVYERNEKLRDFFINRLVFPLLDIHENALGFSGRALSDSQMPKYVNTRETPAYHKGSHLFGLSITKQEIKKKQQALLVEGEFDVLSLYQEGIGNVVAVKGTALTDEQVKLLGRFTKTILFWLDNDAAGKKALLRSLPIIEKHHLAARVVRIDGQKDPDEAIKNDPIEVKKAIKNDENVYDMLLAALVKKHGQETSEGKRKITDVLLPLLAVVDNEIVREHHLRKISEALNVSFESMQKELQKKDHPQNKSQEETKVVIKRSQKEVMEEYLMALILQNEQHMLEPILKIEPVMREYQFSTLAVKRLFTIFTAQIKNDNSIAKAVPAELTSLFQVYALLPLPEFSESKKLQEEVIGLATKLRILSLKEQLVTLSRKIAEKGEEDASLNSEYNRIAGLLKAERR